MEFECISMQAVYPEKQIIVKNDGVGKLIWDCHDGPHILRVGGLRVETGGGSAEPGIAGELRLSPAGELRQAVTAFVQEHRCPLPPPPRGPEVAGAAVLAAFRVPGMNLFIFSEDARVSFRAGADRRLAFEARGTFRSRLFPCKEGDILVHLKPELGALALALLLAAS